MAVKFKALDIPVERCFVNCVRVWASGLDILFGDDEVPAIVFREVMSVRKEEQQIVEKRLGAELPRHCYDVVCEILDSPWIDEVRRTRDPSHTFPDCVRHFLIADEDYWWEIQALEVVRPDYYGGKDR